jgi:hypothetical protein
MRKNGIADYSYGNGILGWTNGNRTVGYNLGNAVRKHDESGLKLADNPFLMAMLHNGAKQTIADAGALSDATVDQKFDAMIARVENLQKEIWIGPRESGNTLLLRAMVKLCDGKHKPFPKRTEQEVRVWIDGQSPKVKRQLARKPAVRDMMDSLRPEAAEIDVSELGL